MRSFNDGDALVDELLLFDRLDGGFFPLVVQELSSVLEARGDVAGPQQ
jgi:hypothetical protein